MAWTHPASQLRQPCMVADDSNKPGPQRFQYACRLSLHTSTLACWPRLYVRALQLPCSRPALMARHLEASAPRPRSAFLHVASGPSSPSLIHGVSGIPVSEEHKCIPSQRLYAESPPGLCRRLGQSSSRRPAELVTRLAENGRWRAAAWAQCRSNAVH